MKTKQLRSITTRLLDQLPELPYPFDVDALCDRLAAKRGRPLSVHTVEDPAFPSGVWFDDGQRDYILVNSMTVSADHRDHIILHEICHLIADHGRMVPRPDTHGDACDDLRDAVGHRLRAHSDIEEQIAESFATRVLREARRVPESQRSPVERRAVSILGVPYD